MTECLEAALGEDQNTDCDLIILYASMGHNFPELLQRAREMAPSAIIAGGSCAGIVGREGVSESMKDVAIMTARCEPGEIVAANVDGLNGNSSFDKGCELGQRLRAQNPGIRQVFFLATGIDISNDQCIAGLEYELGKGVEVMGATTADKMKGESNFQFFDTHVYEDGALAIGFADPTLEALSRATHGFVAVGEPMTVTRSEANRIIELDGQDAWEVYTKRLSLGSAAACADTIPIGALAEELPDELRQEYGSDHILRVVTHRSEDGALLYATDCPVGTKLWLTIRDEDRIYSELDRAVNLISIQSGQRSPVAVFHADCVARGRFMFSRIMKDELVYSMQHPFLDDGEVPPWLGIYGFGEFAKLGGRNTFHNYTSSICALYRR